MAIRVECDNCGHILRNEDQESGAKAESAATLKLEFEGKSLFLMDLCTKCAKQYLKTLKEPLAERNSA